MTLPFPVYRVAGGSAFERGVEHGRQAREQIEALLATYRQIFRDFVRVSWEEARATGEAYRPAIERYDADTAEEIRGVAAGVERPLGDRAERALRGWVHIVRGVRPCHA